MEECGNSDQEGQLTQSLEEKLSGNPKWGSNQKSDPTDKMRIPNPKLR